MPTPAPNQTVTAINNLSAEYENRFKQLTDKFQSLSDSQGTTGATLQTNNIQTEAAISQAEEATTSASKTKNLAIGALVIVFVIGLIFFLKK